MACRAYLLKAASVVVALSMLASPVAASAQAASAMQINAAQVDPLVAFSLYGSPDSRMGLCGMRSTESATSAAVTAANGAAVQPAGNSGCVLPIRDAVPLPVEGPGAIAGAGRFSPLLFLAAGGALALLLFLFNNDDEGNVPPPISPA